MTREERFGRFARRGRTLVRWVFTPVMALWIVACAVMVVNGLRG